MRKYETAAFEMSGRCIGPVPQRAFMQTHMLVDDKFKSTHFPRKTLPKNFFRSKLSDLGSGRKSCKTFVELMNQKGLCQELKFHVADQVDCVSPSHAGARPGIACYRGRRPPVDLKWSQVDLPVQWNSDDDADGCTNILQGTRYFLDNSSNRAKSTLGQLFSYAAEQLSRHRLWVFAVATYGSYARFFRFDRSSIVISAPVKYMENSRIFLEFFWRYARLDAVTRGYDPTVSPASSAECALFDAKIKEYLERAERRSLRKYPGVEDLTNDQYVTSKVRVDDRDGGVSYWIVRKPLAQPHLLLPCGKNTRGYIAVQAPDLDASGLPLGDENEAMNKDDRCELYWLKDSWRLEECEAEADIYHDLKKAKVSHVPVVKCAGDVLQGENEDGDVDEDEDEEEEEEVVEDEHDECDDGGEDEAEDGIDREVQQTTNQKWLSHPGARTKWKGVTGRIQPCMHHRVVQEVVYPLSCVQSARELVRATRDVLETVIEAYYNANLLHLDISKGNVMLTEKFTDGQEESGMLNDWDISHFVGLGTRHRSGTWPFMSIQLLEDPKKPHEIFDDIESILWVMLFTAIHYFKHDQPFNMNTFNERIPKTGDFSGTFATGGGLKRLWLWIRCGNFDCRALDEVINAVADVQSHLLGINRRAHRDSDSKPNLDNYRDELKKDLWRLLKSFDDKLEDPSADWSNGNAVDDLYAPRTSQSQASNSREYNDGGFAAFLARCGKRARDDFESLDEDDSSSTSQLSAISGCEARKGKNEEASGIRRSSRLIENARQSKKPKYIY